MSKSIKGYRKPTHEEITAAAQRIYEAEGRPEGRAVEHWLRAEAQLVAQRKAEAGLSDAKPQTKPAASWEKGGPRPSSNLHAN
jgi:hypothetical protein